MWIIPTDLFQTYPCGTEQNDGYAKQALKRALFTHARHIGPHLFSDYPRGTWPFDDQTMPFSDIFQLFTNLSEHKFAMQHLHKSITVTLDWFLSCLGNDEIYASQDFSYMIGHGMCNAVQISYYVTADESYFVEETPHAFSRIDCDNVKITVHK